MPQPESPSFEPRKPALWAVVVYVLAGLTLCAPMLAGKFLLGDDQLTVGYGFREFGADFFRQNHSIPQWIPYQFGGMPYIAAMHGDIFYPTAWLRWILPIDTAMNIGFAVHIVLAGVFMYLFLRALRLSWTAAVTGGLAWELSGIVVSMMSPGHDGKLYVAALAPLAFCALVRAIRDQKFWGYPLLAMVVGLCLLSPHYQMAYYLIVALSLWTLYLVFLDPERPAGIRWPVALSCALGAVLLGVGISGLQAIPFLHYIPFSPRTTGGPSTGWIYATSYAFPVNELPTTILPQFNGVLGNYWGGNFFKSHTEYVGAAVVMLAVLAFGSPGRRRLLIALGVIAGLFLLVAFGAHTPFYRAWYAVMPMVKKFRAPGMAFSLTALVLCVYAAIGVERLVRGEVRWKTAASVSAVFAVIAVLGLGGILQKVAETLAQPETMERVARNAGALKEGSLRLLIVVAAAGAVLWLITSRTIQRAWVLIALVVVVLGDLWSIDRMFFIYQPPASELFRTDALIERMHSVKPPYRVFDAGMFSQQGSVYHPSHLIVERVESLLGYHGNEERFYDDLLGGKNEWRNIGNLNLWELLAVRFILTPDSLRIPGFHRAMGPVETSGGRRAYLYETDSVPPYVRVTGAAAKIPEDRLVPTVADPRFPFESIVLYPDSASVVPAPIEGSFLPPSPVKPQLTGWKPGDMRISLSGSSTKNSYLLVSETWYPDWLVTVDGKATPALRGDNALLSVVVPPGAKDVHLFFHDRGYATGKWVTALSLLLTLGLLLIPAVRRRRVAGV